MSIENERDLAGLTRVGRVVALTLREMEARLRPGMTTAEVDAIAAAYLRRHGARSAPQLVYAFPGVTCISVNDEAVHGVPGARVIQPGDLVKLDVTAELDGYIADACVTAAVPPVTPAARKLRACAQQALRRALGAARAGQPLSQLGRAIEGETRRRGFTIIRKLHSHGVGRTIHEPPSLPNYYEPRLRGRLTEGLVITVEPIVTTGAGRLLEDDDGWTVRTADGGLVAQFEHTIVITRGQPLILTAA